MPLLRRACETLCVALVLAGTADARPRFTVVDPLSQQERSTFDPRRIDTLPSWERRFSIRGQDYKYRLVGQPPSSGTATTIPTIIVPIRLTVPDPTHAGPPIVFDATPIVPHVIASPLFTAGRGLQFTDAMLRTEFPKASDAWHTLYAATAGPTLDVAMPQGGTLIIPSKSGKKFGYLVDSKPVNDAIADFLRSSADPHTLTVFITYNSVESFAFGYHSWAWGDHAHTSALVYIYSSWMEGIDDAIGFPSPDTATLSHEIVETEHDPLITSVTREWGNHFHRNHCFQKLIEVADAVEDAPLALVYSYEMGTQDGKPYKYTVQNMALLPWFTRRKPSPAQGGAYSFPDPAILSSPAPMGCVGKK